MNKIKVHVLHEPEIEPIGMQLFLAKVTQRGHLISTMPELIDLFNSNKDTATATDSFLELEHGTIKRFTPITVAIMGASRKFLGQLRTHQVGMTCVSFSTQYSDYSTSADFVIPCDIQKNHMALTEYLNLCKSSVESYNRLKGIGILHEDCSYLLPQALRGGVIVNANHQAWSNFLKTRLCLRNTDETAYIAALIWQALSKTKSGHDLFSKCGPACMYRECPEGKMSCYTNLKEMTADEYIKDIWSDVI